MNAETEAVKSVQRLMAEVFDEFLGADGSVERAIEQSGAPPRPFILVEQTAPSSGQEVGVGRELVTVPITVTVYLAAQDTRVQALDAAGEARSLLVAAVQHGVEAGRSTPRRIRRWHYSPRVERHLIGVTADTGTFSITIDRPSGPNAETVEIALGASAAAVADHLEVALAAAGATVQAGDIVGVDRGQNLWEISYGGGLAGVRVGEPSVDASLLAAAAPGVSTRADVLLQGAAAPWRNDSDFLRVEAFSISPPIVDPDDPTLVTLAADLRCTLVRGPHLPSIHRVVQRVETRFDVR